MGEKRDSGNKRVASSLKLLLVPGTCHFCSHFTGQSKSHDQAWHQQGNRRQLSVNSWQLTVGREKHTPWCYTRVKRQAQTEGRKASTFFGAPLSSLYWLIHFNGNHGHFFSSIQPLKSTLAKNKYSGEEVLESVLLDVSIFPSGKTTFMTTLCGTQMLLSLGASLMERPFA